MIRLDNIKEVPRAEWPYDPNTGNHKIVRAFRNWDIVVLEYAMKVRLGWRKIPVRHLAIRTGKVQLYKFYDLMAVKNQICGEEATAVQVYPPESEIMDEANLTHLFVFPPGYKLPLTLQRIW